MKSITLTWDNLNDRNKLICLLNQEKIILAPSDTVWGLCAIPTDHMLKKLSLLKGRVDDKPILILIRSFNEIKDYVEIDFLIKPLIDKIIKKYTPGPLTLVFKASELAPRHFVSNNNTIAFRAPDYFLYQELLKAVPFLFSTSANKAGEGVPEAFDAIDHSIKNNVDVIVGEDKETFSKTISSIPSTILDCSGNEIKYIREGRISFQEITMFLKE